MNPLLEVPRDIIFLLIQHLDICDITRLCRTSKAMAKAVIPRVQEIYYPEKNVWKLEKEKEKENENKENGIAVGDGLIISQRKLIYDKMLRSKINGACSLGHSRYFLTLPPIYLLNSYPSMIKCNVPFLGSVSD